MSEKRVLVRVTVSHKTWARLVSSAYEMVGMHLMERKDTDLVKSATGVTFSLPIEKALHLLRIAPTHEDGLVRLLDEYDLVKYRSIDKGQVN